MIGGSDAKLLPALKVALAGSVKSKRAHDGDAGEEGKTRGTDLGDIALISDLGEPTGAGQLLLRNSRHG